MSKDKLTAAQVAGYPPAHLQGRVGEATKPGPGSVPHQAAREQPATDTASPDSLEPVP